MQRLSQAATLHSSPAPAASSRWTQPAASTRQSRCAQPAIPVLFVLHNRHAPQHDSRTSFISASACQTCCSLLLTCTTMTLQVWVGHRRGFDSAGGLAAWHAWMCSAGNRGAMLTPPGRRAWVHSSLPSPLLDSSAGVPPDADTSGQQQQHSGSGTSPAAAAVAAVCRQMVLYWRRPEGTCMRTEQRPVYVGWPDAIAYVLRVLHSK